LKGCRDSQKKFYDARRKVSKAAHRVAQAHDIDFEQLDVDSDEEAYQKYNQSDYDDSASTCSGLTSVSKVTNSVNKKAKEAIRNSRRASSKPMRLGMFQKGKK